MKKLLLILVAVAFTSMIFGCGGTTDPGPKKAGLPIPDWFLNPPLEPGVAIYGAGTYTMDSMEELQHGKNQAAMFARDEISTSMKVLIQSVAKSYSKKIVTASNKTKFEALSQNVVRQIGNNDIYGAKVVKTDIVQHDGKYILFCLVRIGFDGVAKVMSDANKKEFEDVEAAAAEAFDEMDNLLKEQTKKPFVTESAKPYVTEEAPAPK